MLLCRLVVSWIRGYGRPPAANVEVINKGILRQTAALLSTILYYHVAENSISTVHQFEHVGGTSISVKSWVSFTGRSTVTIERLSGLPGEQSETRAFLTSDCRPFS